MYHEQPRQLADTLRWRYVRWYQRSGGEEIYPLGYCGERLCQHETAEEACRCYKNYLIDTSIILHGGMGTPKQPCAECGVETGEFAIIRGQGDHIHLCNEHMTIECASRHIFVGHSFGS